MATAPGYGYDLAWNGADIASHDSHVTGASLLAQDVLAQLLTGGGGLWYAPLYGCGIMRWYRSDLNSVGAMVVGSIRSTLIKDERIDDILVQLKRLPDEVWRITVTVTPADGSAQFDLAVNVSEVGVSLT